MSLAIFAMIQELKARVAALEEEVRRLRYVEPVLQPGTGQLDVPQGKPGTIRLSKDRPPG